MVLLVRRSHPERPCLRCIRDVTKRFGEEMLSEASCWNSGRDQAQLHGLMLSHVECDVVEGTARTCCFNYGDASR